MYSAAGISIGGETIAQPFVACHGELHTDGLPAQAHELNAGHIDSLVQLKIDVIVVGTGPKQHFFDDLTMRPALENGVGFETMDTRAACRIYNVLVAEQRAVAGVFFPLAAT